MELTESQYQLIQPFLPRHRGNVSLSNLQVLNAILYVAEQGCKWRGKGVRKGVRNLFYFPKTVLIPGGGKHFSILDTSSLIA